MSGIAVIICWIVMIVICAASGKIRRNPTTPGGAPQKTVPASSVKNTQNTSYNRSASGSTVRSGQSVSGSTVRNSQSASESTVRSGQSASGSTVRNSQSGQNASRSQNTARGGRSRSRNTARSSQGMRQRSAGYSQSLSGSKEDILTRANRNTQQQFAEDILEQKQKDIPKDREEQQLMFVEENTDLMKEVFDLMIVGPDTSTYYDRDFVAEGVEMINRSLESV